MSNSYIPDLNSVRDQNKKNFHLEKYGGGGWLDSLGSGILVGKKYFGVLQQY